MKKFGFLIVYLSCMFATTLQAYSAKEIPLHYTVDQAIALINPENEIEKAVISDRDWIEGARWGKPRKGHPEGAVIYHIHEVLENVETYYGQSPMREKLRIIAIIHDTFKYKANEEGHALLARRFAEKYLSEQNLLDIIERHDDAYYAWLFGAEEGDWDKALVSANELIDFLGKDLELFTAFYQCDNRTGNKTHDDVEWFEGVVAAGMPN
jgi:HD domain